MKVSLQDLARARSLLAHDEGARQQVADARRRLSRASHADVLLARYDFGVIGRAVEGSFDDSEIYLAPLDLLDELLRVAVAHDDAFARMRGEVPGEDGGRHAVAHGAGAAEPHGDGAQVALCERAHLVGETPVVVLGGIESTEDQVCRLGRYDAAADLAEQRASVMGFELTDVLRDRGLRDVELARCGREAALAVDREKGMRTVVEHGAPPASGPWPCGDSARPLGVIRSERMSIYAPYGGGVSRVRLDIRYRLEDTTSYLGTEPTCPFAIICTVPCGPRPCF